MEKIRVVFVWQEGALLCIWPRKLCEKILTYESLHFVALGKSAICSEEISLNSIKDSVQYITLSIGLT